ncbi:hypothetical protein C0J52_06195 [Blattella germanica]|nr:hypothetical protein C0J52_06195 [Blattella germanica]
MFFALNNSLRRNCTTLLRCYKTSLPAIWERHHSYDSDGKSTVQILNKEAEGLMIDSYSQIGFRLNNGMYVLGPMAIFPRTVLSWNVGDVEEINEDSLSLFCLLEPKLDILVLGAGDTTSSSKLNKQVLSFMVKYRINVEILPTEQACATFNFLNAENRYIAGALIPPISLRPTDDDILLTKLKHRKLLISDEDDK